MFEFELAKRLYKNREGSKNISKPGVLIAVLGIAIGFIVMLLAVAIIVGFKAEIRNKVVGFSSDIQLTNYNTAATYESHPIAITDSLVQDLMGYETIESVQRYSTRVGMIKTDEAFQGMMLKGMAQEFDTSFFEKHMVEGRLPQFSDSETANEIVLSKTLADLLNIKIDDRIFTYFAEGEGMKTRRLTVVGFYQTNFYEFDKLYLLTDLFLVNRLNRWNDNQASGVEIRLTDYSKLDEITDELADQYGVIDDHYGEPYIVMNVEQLNGALFGWLELLDLNVWVILCLMMGIAGFTVVSGLLILILERTQMIGLLKGLGATNKMIRKVFIWLATFLIIRGLIIGNIIGLAFCYLQDRFHLIALDPVTYHVDSVPVSVSFWWVALLNIATVVIAVLMLVGPSYMIAKINPATSMRYE